MRFVPASVDGAFVIEIEAIQDDRGFFARNWSRKALEDMGLDGSAAECSISFNPRRGTLRGMHYQAEPHGETKVVRCTSGAIYDVVVDLRRESATFGRWSAVELSAVNRRSVYVPKGVAHGFLTLLEGVEVSYQISTPYVADSARGVRWDDPAFGIRWPADVPISLMSRRDRSYPFFAR